MKKHGILNSEISKILADLGHTDQIVIGDSGLPVPENVKKIDLALKEGSPSFLEVLDTLLKEMKVEKALLAEEIKSSNPKMLKKTIEQLNHYAINESYTEHEKFKEQTKQAKAIIRTGESTPYANVILQAGVLF